jgi:hypothetical protein
VGVRETVNQRPYVSMGVAAGVIVLALIAITWEIHRGEGNGPLVGKAFFSDDDGKTYFPESIDKLPPFEDANGKTAYQAMVYQCGAKPPFVGYLQRYTDQAKSELETSGGLRGRPGMTTGIEVKRPGAQTWVRFDPRNRKAYDDIIIVTCKGTTDRPKLVTPGRD